MKTPQVPALSGMTPLGIKPTQPQGAATARPFDALIELSANADQFGSKAVSEELERLEKQFIALVAVAEATKRANLIIAGTISPMQDRGCGDLAEDIRRALRLIQEALEVLKPSEPMYARHIYEQQQANLAKVRGERSGE